MIGFNGVKVNGWLTALLAGCTTFAALGRAASEAGRVSVIHLTEDEFTQLANSRNHSEAYYYRPDTGRIAYLPSSNQMRKRQAADYYNWQIVNQWNEPGDWQVASCCAYSQLDSSGGSVEITWGISYGYSAAGGFSFGPVAELLTLNFGVTVTETATTSVSNGCNIPGGAVGQMWARPWYSYSNEQSQWCNWADEYYECGAWSPYIFSAIPLSRGGEYGCSAGTSSSPYENTNCPASCCQGGNSGVDQYGSFC